MAKQVQVRYVYNAGALECRDITVGRVYDAELPSFGEVDKDGAEVQRYDELWITKDDAGDTVVTHLSAGFELVGEQDDLLPPAPESVRYYTSPAEMNYLDIYMTICGELCIAATSDRDTFYNHLDADAALQLAHDLTRMAMEIKRKQKQQERKITLNPAIAHPYGE